MDMFIGSEWPPMILNASLSSFRTCFVGLMWYRTAHEDYDQKEFKYVCLSLGYRWDRAGGVG